MSLQQTAMTTASPPRGAGSYPSSWSLSLLMSSLLLGVGALALLATNSWITFAFCAAPCVGLSFAILCRELYYCRIHVFLLTATATLVWYFAPLIVAAVPGSVVPLPEDGGATAIAIAVILACLVPVLILSILFPNPVAVGDWTAIASQKRFVTVFLAICAAVQATLIASGRWTYGSLSSNIQESSKTLLLFMSSVSLVTLPLSGALLALTAREGKRHPLRFCVIAGCLAIDLIWSLIAGRRIFATALVISGASFFNVFWRNVPVRRRLVQALVSGVLGIVVVITGWQTFYMFRFVSYSIRHGETMPPITVMYERASQADTREANIQYASNLAVRGLIIDSATVVVEKGQGVLYGEGLVNAALVSVPAAVFPGKHEWEEAGGGGQETLWAERLGVPLNDWANTLLLDSYCDFSVFGLTVYLILIQYLIYFLMKIFRNSPIAGCAIPIVFAQALINVETGFTTLLSTARDLGLILSILVIAHAIFTYRRPSVPLRRSSVAKETP